MASRATGSLGDLEMVPEESTVAGQVGIGPESRVDVGEMLLDTIADAQRVESQTSPPLTQGRRSAPSALSASIRASLSPASRSTSTPSSPTRGA